MAAGGGGDIIFGIVCTSPEVSRSNPLLKFTRLEKDGVEHEGVAGFCTQFCGRPDACSSSCAHECFVIFDAHGFLKITGRAYHSHHAVLNSMVVIVIVCREKCQWADLPKLRS